MISWYAFPYYERFSYNMDSDTVSRLERDSEVERTQKRNMSSVLSNIKPFSEANFLPLEGIVSNAQTDAAVEWACPRIVVVPGQKTVSKDPTHKNLFEIYLPIIGTIYVRNLFY